MQEVLELQAEIREHKRLAQLKIRRLQALCKKYGIPLTIKDKVDDDKARSKPNS